MFLRRNCTLFPFNQNHIILSNYQLYNHIHCCIRSRRIEEIIILYPRLYRIAFLCEPDCYSILLEFAFASSVCWHFYNAPPVISSNGHLSQQMKCRKPQVAAIKPVRGLFSLTATFLHHLWNMRDGAATAYSQSSILFIKTEKLCFFIITQFYEFLQVCTCLEQKPSHLRQ